jgi:hypothetical protein
MAPPGSACEGPRQGAEVGHAGMGTGKGKGRGASHKGSIGLGCVGGVERHGGARPRAQGEGRRVLHGRGEGTSRVGYDLSEKLLAS